LRWGLGLGLGFDALQRAGRQRDVGGEGRVAVARQQEGGHLGVITRQHGLVTRQRGGQEGGHLVPHELQSGRVGVRAWLGLGSD
jgi:hypothetical protein